MQLQVPIKKEISPQGHNWNKSCRVPSCYCTIILPHITVTTSGVWMLHRVHQPVSSCSLLGMCCALDFYTLRWTWQLLCICWNARVKSGLAGWVVLVGGKGWKGLQMHNLALNVKFNIQRPHFSCCHFTCHWHVEILPVNNDTNTMYEL